MWRDNPTNTIRFSLCPNLCYVTKRICELLNKSIKSNLISALYNKFIFKSNDANRNRNRMDTSAVG